MTRFADSKLVIATHNEGKLREFKDLLAAFSIELTSAKELKLSEPEETGTNFSENALIKARAVHQATGLAALADDSGLCVTALNNDPGLFSARWAGPDRDFDLAMRKVHEALGDAADRSAHFMCCLALIGTDGAETLIEGRVNGTIVWPPRGKKGHGYDPVFMPEGETRTFAEMEEDEKNAISHRGRALRALVEQCFKKAE